MHSEQFPYDGSDQPRNGDSRGESGPPDHRGGDDHVTGDNEHTIERVDRETLDELMELRRARHELEAHQIELNYQNRELKRLTEELEQSRNRYRILFENAPVGYVTVDERGMIRRANDTFGEFTGIDSLDLQDVPLGSLFAAADRHVFYSRWTAFAHQPAGKIMILRLEDGPIVQITGTRSGPSDGTEADEILLVIADVTQQQEARRELERSESILRVHREIAKVFLLDPTRGAYATVAARLAEHLDASRVVLLVDRDDHNQVGYASDAETDHPLVIARDEPVADDRHVRTGDEADVVRYRDARLSLDGAQYAEIAVVPIRDHIRGVGRVVAACTDNGFSTSELGSLVSSARFIAPIVVARLAAEEEEQRRHAAEQEIRRSLAEKEVLLREIHHRVKNNLQVVASLLSIYSLRSTNATPEEILAKTQQRVHAMAQVHELLYRSGNLAGIDIRAYAAELLKNLTSVYDAGPRVDVEVTGDSVPVELDLAVPCALILNELASNAFKYAFEGREHGTIRIVISREDDQTLLVRLSDDGVGNPDALDFSGRDSLGLHIVGVLVRQIDGRLESLSEGGLTYELRIPLTGDRPQ